MKKKELTQELLMELLHYDPDTGIFTWNLAKGRRVKKGSIAGTITDQGYVSIIIDGKKYKAHRLAWLYSHNRWPNNQIDHKDTNRSNNALKNLREATQSENMQNINLQKIPNKLGFNGVCKHIKSKRYGAQIRVDGKQKKLGTFSTPEEAHEAYLTAKRELHPFSTL